MRTRLTPRGATLVESMVATVILLVSGMGLIGLNRQSNLLIADSRQATRAGVFAQDLATQIELWDFNDPRLANPRTGNDANPGDGFELALSDMAVQPDHGEADLTLGGASWTGLPKEYLEANGMERYWNVSAGDNADGDTLVDALRVAVVVRWKPPGASLWRKAVFFVVKRNPADFL